MSYTMDFLLLPLSKSDKKAWKEIEGFRESYYQENSDPKDIFKDFLKTLESRYPCSCSYDEDDPAMEESPWADGPLVNNFKGSMGMLAIVYSKAEEVVPFVEETAKKFNITVADGQTGAIYRNGIEPLQESKPWWKFW